MSAVSYRWAVQIAGCPVLFLSHADAPTDTGGILEHEGGDYSTRPHAIDADTQLVMSRIFDIDRGVVGEDQIKVILQSDRRTPATCPFRHIGRRGFRGVDWKAALLEDIAADEATPDIVMSDVGQSISNGDFLHIGPEAFLVDTVTDDGDQLTIETSARSCLGTDRISHRTDPTIDDVPYVTPQPLTWRGRRALLWRAQYHMPSGLGTWRVAYRGDIDTEAGVGTRTLAFKIISIAARRSVAVGATIRPVRLSRRKHVFADDVGCWLRVFAWADQGELYQALVVDDSNGVDDIAVELGPGEDDADERHQGVADVAAGLPAGHPRTVPVRLPRQRVAMNVDGYDVRNVGGTDYPTLELDAAVPYPIATGETVVSTEVAETLWVRLVDTSAGLVAVRPSSLVANWNAKDVARSADIAPAGNIYGATFCKVSARAGAEPGQRTSALWHLASKIAPQERVTLLLADSPARSQQGPPASVLRRLWRSQSVEGDGWYGGSPRGLQPPEETPTGSSTLTPLAWSWGPPAQVHAARRDASGQIYAEDAFHAQVDAQTVQLRHLGDTARVPRSSVSAAWYQAGEPYITLEGPTGVGGGGRLILEVREDEKKDVIARCAVVGESEVESGVWAVEVEQHPPSHELHLPTLAEDGRPGGRRYTFTPAFIAEGAPAGETVARLLTSAGGDALFSEYDTEAFGTRLRDGTGSMDTSVMGRDVDIETVLGLPSIAGARTSVIGRPGDKLSDLVDGLIRGAGYVLDLVVRDDVTDPHDGCLLALRPIGTPTRAEVRGTIGQHDIEMGGSRLIDPGLRNVFNIAANHTADGPQIEIRATADTSIWANGESRARDIDLSGVYFDDVEQALDLLRPILTRAVAEEAFPRDRYELAVSSEKARLMAVGDVWTITDDSAPRSDGALGISGLCRIIAVAHEPRQPYSVIRHDFYGEGGGMRAPSCAVVDVIDATTLEVAPNFFADERDPISGTAHTDLELLVSPDWGEGLGTGINLRVYDAGDPDGKRALVVDSYDLGSNEITFTAAHGVAVPGAAVDPQDYIAVIIPAAYADAPAGHQDYFHHGRDPIG